MGDGPRGTNTTRHQRKVKRDTARDRETYALESSRQADHKAPKKSHYYPTRNRNQNADVEESD